MRVHISTSRRGQSPSASVFYQTRTSQRPYEKYLVTRCESIVPFTPIENRSSYSLRLIQPHTVAKTTYTSRGDGYLSLGSYMSGANQNEEKFPETQPILMTYYKTSVQDPNWSMKTMQVYLKSDSDVPSLPKSNDVCIEVSGGEVVAARKFQGQATEEVCMKELKALLSAMEKDGLDSVAASRGAVEFQLAQYGPLHSLTPRLNEIWVKVKMS
jgi:hypothetical protein